MAVTARVYYNSGFNTVNIPRTPEVLNDVIFDFEDVPALDILQPAEINQIKLKMTYSQAKNVDFLRLDNIYYYAVNGFEMTSADVAVFSVTMIYFLTLGGPDKIEITDGEIVRSHYIPGDDVGDIVDPLMSPSYESQRYATVIYTEAQPADYQYPTRVNYFDNSGLPYGEDGFKGSKGGIPVYVSNYSPQSATDLIDLSKPIELIKNGENYIYSPNYQTQALKAGVVRTGQTKIGLHKYDGTQLSFLSIYPGPCFYDQTILETARYLYAYGVPTPIEDAYVIPEGYSIATKDGNGLYEQILGRCIQCRFNASLSHIINGKFDNNEEVLPYPDYVYDAILNSAVQIKLTATGTGQSATIAPQNMQNKETIYVDMIADPSPTGCPYFKIKDKIDFDVSGTFSGAEVYANLSGAVKGATWLRVPIVFANQNYLRDLHQFLVRDAAAASSIKNEYNRASDIIGITQARGTVLNILGAVTGTAAGVAKENPLDILGASGNFLMNQEALSFQTGIASTNNEYATAAATNQRMQAVEEFASNHMVNEYETKYALTDSLALLTGNGALVEVIYPDIRDINKFVNVVQRFGFAQTRPAEHVDFNTLGEKYIFVQTTGLQLTGNGTTVWPSRYYNIAASEINGGVRLWDIKPDNALYKERFKVKEGTANVV